MGPGAVCPPAASYRVHPAESLTGVVLVGFAGSPDGLTAEGGANGRITDREGWSSAPSE